MKKINELMPDMNYVHRQLQGRVGATGAGGQPASSGAESCNLCRKQCDISNLKCVRGKSFFNIRY